MVLFAACFKNRSKRRAAEEFKEDQVLFICFKNGLFQEQEETQCLFQEGMFCCSRRLRTRCSSVQPGFV